MPEDYQTIVLAAYKKMRWYKGFVKDHKFFTAVGTYPTETTRVLKSLHS